MFVADALSRKYVCEANAEKAACVVREHNLEYVDVMEHHYDFNSLF